MSYPRSQEGCEHKGKIDITTFSDPSRVWLCNDCGYSNRPPYVDPLEELSNWIENELQRIKEDKWHTMMEERLEKP